MLYISQSLTFKEFVLLQLGLFFFLSHGTGAMYVHLHIGHYETKGLKVIDTVRSDLKL